MTHTVTVLLKGPLVKKGREYNCLETTALTAEQT